MKLIPETYRGSSSGVHKRQKPVIEILLKGGFIYDIVDIPEGTTVRVWDFDTQGVDSEKLVTSPYDDGVGNQKAILTYWE